MEMLEFLDDASKAVAFGHHRQKLGEVDSLQVPSLRVCVMLLPSPDQDSQEHEELADLVLNHIPPLSNDVERLYQLAEACFSNPKFGSLVFDRVTTYLAALAYAANRVVTTEHDDGDAEDIVEISRLRKGKAWLNFLKCCFWLPPTSMSHLGHETLHLLVESIGVQGLDQQAHDALGALLSLMSAAENREQYSLLTVNQSLWSRLKLLESSYFSSNSSKVFRSCFQWGSLAVKYNIELDSIHDSLYWERLRIGLLTGFSDQRKFILGTIQQSLNIAKRSIRVPLMDLDVERRAVYEAQYTKYCTLFETIILDRYPNQVLACLPELTSLLGAGSVISPGWTTALLSASLNHTIQDGIRKIIGNWYMKYALEGRCAFAHHTDFFVEGFLPWATQGSLFTSSLAAQRSSTACAHGSSLSRLVTIFITNLSPAEDREKLLDSVLKYILGTGGRIFQPSILYLLEGFIAGLENRPLKLEPESIDLIIRISRLPGSPDIARDLRITYCAHLCKMAFEALDVRAIPGLVDLQSRYRALARSNTEKNRHVPVFASHDGNISSLSEVIRQLESTRHKVIQDEKFGPACRDIIRILERTDQGALSPAEMYNVLDAMWEEADRQEFYRPVAVALPPVMFHLKVVNACVEQYKTKQGSDITQDLVDLLTKAMVTLGRFSEGRTYLLATLAKSLRQAAMQFPQIVSILPYEEFIARFIVSPPAPKKEFLFEAVFAEKLTSFMPSLDYTSYYGEREWIAYATVIDLFNHFPTSQIDVLKSVFNRVLDPWKSQMSPVPIISKWKDILQLQVMLMLTESCVTESDAEEYIGAFMHALVVEQWPRYRFLLEWIIVRIYYRFPAYTQRILSDLEQLDENSPIQIASLVKLAVLTTPFLDSEVFALSLMIQLIPLSGSPKVHIRHESHWCFPILFNLAVQRNWTSITSNPAFKAMDSFIRTLDRFNNPRMTIRTLQLDAVGDFTLTDIFQGLYLIIETPEAMRVTFDDFVSAASSEDVTHPKVLPFIPLGEPKMEIEELGNMSIAPEHDSAPPSSDVPNPSFLQTKAGIDLSTLIPPRGPPSAQRVRPASVILIASLIDNPTNLGGLSRISESFGFDSLHIDDMKKIGHKEFKATSVNSEKHFPIRELKIADVPSWLMDVKREGWTIVGIEQTDRSVILGDETTTIATAAAAAADSNEVEAADGIVLGTLPQKCVLVLGSEKGGISAEVLAALDRCVEIKTVGVTRSLNVQTAAGIVGYEWWRVWGGERTNKGR